MSMPANKYFSDERGSDLRFAAPGQCKTFRVSTLWDSHREICRRLALGEKASDIATALGVSKAMVSYTKNSKAAKDQISILRGAMDADTIDLGIRIQKFAPVALQLLEDIIEGHGDGKDASITLRAHQADKYLDRAGYSPVKKIASISTTLTRADIEAIKERSRRSAQEAGIIEAEIVNE
jgi:transcriptional regulator with XRE-family HTH domain